MLTQLLTENTLRKLMKTLTVLKLDSKMDSITLDPIEEPLDPETESILESVGEWNRVSMMLDLAFTNIGLSRDDTPETYDVELSKIIANGSAWKFDQAMDKACSQILDRYMK
jgi:hypothetical protein